MCARTCLNADEAGGQRREELQQLRSANAFADHHRAIDIYAVNLKNRVGAGAGTQRAVQVTAGSLANGLQGGNGAPPGTRLIDMPVMPLPPGSGMPPTGATQFSSDEL